jgi:putative pyrroloquinoline-quinone-binding quinoprotein
MSRHRRVERRSGVPGAALVVCACGALGGDPRLAEPGRAPREPVPASMPRRALQPGPEQAVAAARREPSPAALPSPPPSSPPPSLPLLASPEPEVQWRFRSATALSGAPAVSPDGLVYLASVEGYLHALAPDGSFRWSYGLGDMPVGAPAVDPAGHVFVATTAPRLFAFRPDGHPSWAQGVPSRFATPPVWAAPGTIYYAGRDRNLYSVSAWGGAPQPYWLGGTAAGALASLGDGAVAVGLEASEAQVFRRASLLARLELPAPGEQPLLGGKAHWFAVTRAGLAAFDVSTRAPVWTAPARRAGLSADERALAIEIEGDLVWLEPASGRELHRVQLPEAASSPPVLTNSGVALVPLVAGALLMVEPHSQRLARVALGPAPAWPPAWSEVSQRVTAAAGGDVVGIDLSGWVGLDSGPPEGDAPPSEAPSEPPPGDEARPSTLGSRSLERRSPSGGA